MVLNWQRRVALVASAVVVLAAAGPAGAQIGDGPPDPNLSLKDRQSMRFPQPVRVGDLAGRHVISGGNRLRQIGTVVGVFRSGDDDLSLVFRYHTIFGLGGRPIAPDISELDLVGPYLKVIDLDPKDLSSMPTFKPANGAFLKPDDIIRLGVDRKY